MFVLADLFLSEGNKQRLYKTFVGYFVGQGKRTDKVASMSFCPNSDRGHQKRYSTMQQHMQSSSSTWPIAQPIKPPHEAENSKAEWQAAETGKQIIWELHQNLLCNLASVTHGVEGKRFALAMVTCDNSC